MDESNLVTAGAIRDAIILRDCKRYPYLSSRELPSYDCLLMQVLDEICTHIVSSY